MIFSCKGRLDWAKSEDRMIGLKMPSVLMALLCPKSRVIQQMG